jgi:hypothetical protein
MMGARLLKHPVMIAALAAALVMSAFAVPAATTGRGAHVSAAAAKPFMLAQAEGMALSADPEIKSIYSQILMKKINYTDTITSTQVKIKNQNTPTYTPLLSFTLPDPLKMSDELDMNVQPLALASEILTLQHQMNDERYEALSEARKAYCDAYIFQEQTSFIQDQLTEGQNELARARANMLVGQADQSDVDDEQDSVTKLGESLAEQLREYLSAKQSLSDIVNLDVTSGYRFVNPLRDEDITRDQLGGIVNYTLNEDQGVFTARATESLDLLKLNTVERLMRNKYGNALNRISPFITIAKQGGDIDYSAFKAQYRNMLTDIDASWAGAQKILFMDISKDLLKGKVDGTRYIEDEPYELYTACMDYASARTARAKAESDLTKKVNSDYEALVTARNKANSLTDSVNEAKTSLDRLLILNTTGKTDFSDVQKQTDEYQSLQLAALDAISTYNDQLIAFDRLTCGAVTMYFKGRNFESGIGSALSYPTKDGLIWYYIYTDVSDLTFVFGLDVPENFSPAVTEYELWYENVDISGRVDVSDSFKHLTLDYGDTSTLTVKLYGDDGYVGECDINTSVSRATLSIENEAANPPVSEEQTIGSYRIETKITGNVGVSMLTPEFDARVKARYYRLRYGGDNIVSSDLVPVGEGFNYLTLLVKDLSNVDLFVYGKNKKRICKAKFDVTDQTIKMTVKPSDEGDE